MGEPDAKHDPVMNDAEFRMFTELLRRHCGLHFGPESRFLLEKRLARRLRELEITSFASYHYMLRNARPGDDEFANLVDELVTNETYFLRERSQLKALVSEIFTELRVQRRMHSRGPISVWSAGCSSGEEPYSIVILALEAGIDVRQELRVYASDISRKMLRRARQGEYREAAFRETEPQIREKYFMEKDGVWRISDAVKQHVDFIHLNLVDRSRIALLGAMDVILCRNVIIYFDIEGKRRVIETFHEKLRPGGHLLLGHAETLINLSTSFELRHLPRDLVYRKPLAGMAPADPWHAAAADALVRVDERRGRG
jgi:chemotaxis protein methyltransferase CheR